MDVLRQEINEVYEAQHLRHQHLDQSIIAQSLRMISAAVAMDADCRVITDAAADRCWIHAGSIGHIIGLPESDCHSSLSVDSSDEDSIYTLLHPEDLVEKRMLEYEFFKLADALPADEKLDYKAVSRIRIMSGSGDYIYLDNSTQIMHLAPSGSFWLILCRYAISADQSPSDGIMPAIMNLRTGQISPLNLASRRQSILSPREREILVLIREGKLSKEIADILSISPHTVSRHRQNILQKLSVDNSMEAVRAATAMRLI